MVGDASSQNPLESLEMIFSESTKNGTWPGVVVAATNRSGSFHYANAFGKDECTSEGRPFTMSSIMALASMSKFMTSIAALQLIEKGLVDLETDVSSLIPTLARQEVLYGWDAAGRPLTQQRKNPITLRSLLTHSSGTGYDMSNPELARFAAYKGREVNSGTTIDKRFGYPLVFEPDTAWEYGTGIDWVGQLVERLARQTLEIYMQRHIWEPLGISRMTFWPSTVSGRIAPVKISVRDQVSGGFSGLKQPFLTEGVTDCFGGQGVYGSMEDFLKVLHSILADDGKLLTSRSVDMMFQPQLLLPSREALLKRVRNSTPESSFIGIFDKSLSYDWGLGGMLAMENEPSGRRRNTLFWSGMPNLFWVRIKSSSGFARY
ncbi:predicted protein [Aspergillus terreus NIH2624]|uniref:Beta-lactamase-related domain-containing protein n=1 Tax=Aspergillus terreus (strain NIH 2624 / FGSC A1156) TaxID=341663 RepID=Q0CRS3_ASPTN|nr:uncharacterized protein ATEG_03611 [Aspergillus terreus NIH2624]EAU35413.1 predicted protein [Aspergillus terreus NIH2624]